MEFKRFADYLKERDKGVFEAVTANKEAMAFDTKLAAFHNRFPDGNGEEIVKANGYPDIRSFLHDGGKKKWAKLKIPGQGNYVQGHVHRDDDPETFHDH